VNELGTIIAGTVDFDENFKGRQAVTYPVRKCLENDEESKGVWEDYAGQTVVGSSVCIPGLKWVLVTEVREDEVLKYAVALKQLLSLILVPVIAAIIFIGLYFSRRLTEPLESLSRVAKKINEGDFTVRADVSTKDEIGVLGRTLNSMIESLISANRKFQSKSEELAEKAREALEQNTNLQNIKKAILNLLEDTQALGEELKREKEGIEQKVVERTREVKEEQAKLVAAIQGLSFGFVLVDNSGTITLTNPAAANILDIKDVTMDWISKQLGDKVNLSELIQKSHAEKGIIDLKDIELGNKILRIFLAPIITDQEGDKIIGTIILIEDITEAKMTERSREEFFAIASHEMRTPLTAIRGNMSLIKDFYGAEIKNPEVNEMIADSYSASVRLIDIVNDFLDASRLEQGRITLKKENVDLADLSKEVIHELSVLAEPKKLTLKFKEKKGAPLPPAFADRDRAKQVIANFISNAIHYTPKGGVTVEVMKEGDFMKVFVTDTGEGISPQNQNRLFRKFQQAGKEMLARDVTKSTGLGLYISKLLVETMGGKIWLEKSEVGKGSTFAFTLPIAS